MKKTICFMGMIVLLCCMNASSIYAGVQSNTPVQLFEYLQNTKVKEIKSVDNTAEIIKINTDLFNASYPQSIEFEIESIGYMTAMRENEETMLNNIKVWYGKIDNQEYSSVILVNNGEILLADILTASGHFAIKNENGISYLIKLPDAEESVTTIERDYEKISLAARDINSTEPVDSSGTPMIRVLVGWQIWGNNITHKTYIPDYNTTQAAMYIAQTNQAFSRSDANAQVKLVQSIAIHAYDGSNVWHYAGVLNYIGGEDPLWTARDKYAADLVIVMESLYDGEYGLHSGDYAVVCSASVCDNGYAFPRYIGHLLGCGVQEPYDEYLTYSGLYDYSHGYVASDGSFKTLVTHVLPSTTVILNYSNPLVSYNGEPTGVDKNETNPADNVSTINLRAPIVAAYRGEPKKGISATITATPGSGIAPLDVTLEALVTDESGSSVTVTTWEWDLGDGSPVENLESITHTYDSPGTYVVTLTVTDSNSYTTTANATIRVFQQDDLAVSVILSPSYIKANGKERGTITAYITESSSGELVTDEMDLVFSAENGTVSGDVVFDKTTGKYTDYIISGEPGTDTISATVENQVSNTAQIQYTWPQPPANPTLQYTTAKSLFKGLHFVNISWEENPSDIYEPAKYRVYRSQDGGEFQLLSELSADVYSYSEESLPAGPVYRYVLTTVDTEGDESAYSVEMEVR